MMNGLKIFFCVLCIFAYTLNAEPAFKIFGKETSLKQLKEDENEKGEFYELEKNMYDKISQAAQVAYVNAFWEKNAKQSGKSVDTFRREYMEKNGKVPQKTFDETYKQLSGHPKLKDLSDAEKRKQIKEHLEGMEQQKVMSKIVQEGFAKGDLAILYPEPKEPVYNIKLFDTDMFRYGPTAADVKPKSGGCEGDKCPITVMEFSEYECPYCEKVLNETKQVMSMYQGKIRWVVRDFPLSFHKRAKPAAIAAKCAAFQGKYWDMYFKLFSEQQNLEDSNFQNHAKSLALNLNEFNNCVKNPGKALSIIEKNISSGMKVGVGGTPSFYVNGRRLPNGSVSEFKRVIDDELSKSGNKKS